MILTLEVIGAQAAKLGSGHCRTFASSGGIIGRDRSSDWVLSHTKVSARHATVSYSTGVFYIEDTSTNGVFINSPKNRLERGRPYPLRSGGAVAKYDDDPLHDDVDRADHLVDQHLDDHCRGLLVHARATSATAPAEGASGQVGIGTLPTCAWTAQSFASWLTVTPPSGAGPASVTYTAAPNVNGPARTGTLVIAGLTFSVTQAAPPPPDLIPVLPVSTSSCGFSSGQYTVTAQATNAGIGPSVVNSAARITFVTGPSTTPDQNVGPLAIKAQTPLTFVLPTTCFNDGVCNFTITLDATGTVFESNEANNAVTSSCNSGSTGLAGRGSDRSPQ